MTYRTIEVAERMLDNATRDTWALADAVLADVPEQQGARADLTSTPRGVEVPDVAMQLAMLADALSDAGVTKPDGDPYSADSLRHLRATAMAWPPEERHAEAAYRTHQEAGGRENDSRLALAALCAVARGERPDCPPGLDPAHFSEAASRVRDRMAARPRRFPVTANDVRTAMRRRTNVTPRGTTTTELLALLSGIGEGARTFARTLVSSDAGLRDEDRNALVAVIERQIVTLQGLIAIVRGVTDADVEALLSEESGA